MADTRTYWLSFTDSDRPKGQQFLGVVVVDVPEALAAAGRPVLDRDFPSHDREVGPWIYAATQLAWAAGVNPGGSVASVRIDDSPNFPMVTDLYPRLRLISRDELERIEAHIEENKRRTLDTA